MSKLEIIRGHVEIMLNVDTDGTYAGADRCDKRWR